MGGYNDKNFKNAGTKIVSAKHSGGKSTIKGVSSGKKGVDPFVFANKIPMPSSKS